MPDKTQTKESTAIGGQESLKVAELENGKIKYNMMVMVSINYSREEARGVESSYWRLYSRVVLALGAKILN